MSKITDNKTKHSLKISWKDWEATGLGWGIIALFVPIMIMVLIMAYVVLFPL